MTNHPLVDKDRGELADAFPEPNLFWLWIEEFDTVISGTVVDLDEYKTQGYNVYQLCPCAGNPLNEQSFEDFRSMYVEAKQKAQERG